MRKTIALALLAALAGCGGKQEAAPAARNVLTDAPAGTPVVTVEGEVVTEPLLQAWAARRRLDVSDPAQRQRALDGLVDAVLLARDALNSNLAQNDQVRADLAQARIEQLANANIAAFRASTPVTDEQVKAFYDEEAVRAGGVELQLQHILFADEALARAALEVAKQPGADFQQIMEGYASTARQAKQLDWANLSQLPAELGQAVKALQDGELAAQPIQTQYGWHVVKRVASRPFTPPPLEQVRESAKRQLGEQVLRERIQALREKATVLMPGGEAAK
jgi:peptidyl-prolyl cis-trans isomerase C